MSADNPIHSDRYCIHQVTLMEQCSFQQSIECFTRHGIAKTAVWRQKLDEIGADEGRQILSGNGVEAVALCAAVLLGNDGPATVDQCIDQNRRLLEQAAAIGAPSMVVITGGLEGYGQDLVTARSRAVEVLARLAPHAKDIGVKLMLEPLHPMVCGNRSVISTLQEANEMLDAVGMDDTLGIALDTYALWWQTDLKEQIELTGQRICHLHVSDWLPDTCDVRLDRGMPGDGLIDNRLIRQWLESTGFDGAVEVEIFSQRNWWKRNQDEVVSVILERYPRYL